MYAEGSRLLGLPAAECLFIDDDPDLVAAARALGHPAVTLDRHAAGPGDARVISSLDELVIGGPSAPAPDGRSVGYRRTSGGDL